MPGRFWPSGWSGPSARADLRSPEGRARAAAVAMAVVAEHPNALVRDQYVMQIADRCQVDPARLRADWARRAESGEGRARSAGPVPAPPGPGDPIGGAGRGSAAAGPAVGQPELEALRLAIHRRETVVDRLSDVLFADALNLSVFRALLGRAHVAEAIAAADPDAADLLLAWPWRTARKIADDVMVRLVDRAGKRALDQLHREARHAPAPEEYGGRRSAGSSWPSKSSDPPRIGLERPEARLVRLARLDRSEDAR